MKAKEIKQFILNSKLHKTKRWLDFKTKFLFRTKCKCENKATYISHLRIDILLQFDPWNCIPLCQNCWDEIPVEVNKVKKVNKVMTERKNFSVAVPNKETIEQIKYEAKEHGLSISAFMLKLFSEYLEKKDN